MNIPQITEQLVMETLSQVLDPELGCNIADLGLIYNVEINGPDVAVLMTLTTPGCPMHESISLGAENALRSIEGVRNAKVEVVWEPPWNPSMMTERGREMTGVR